MNDNKARLVVPALLILIVAFAATANAGRVRTAIDGTYRQHSTAADIAAAGGAPDEATNRSNWGNFVWIFDRGRFALNGKNGFGCGWAYGRFTIKGAQIVLTFITDGGPGARVSNIAGEQFRFGWSLYRGSLTFTAVAGAISPASVLATPLRLVSKTPSRRFFFKKPCAPPKAALP